MCMVQGARLIVARYICCVCHLHRYMIVKDQSLSVGKHGEEEWCHNIGERGKNVFMS